MTTPLLQIEGLSKKYRVGSTAIPAVDGLSLEVEAGQTLAIVGESGSGKTTLANLILGTETPSAGTIKLAGETLPSDRSRTQRRRIGLVQQNPYSALNPRKSIFDAVALPLSVQHIGDRRSHRSQVQALLSSVGLSDALMDRRPLALSGGQRQRVAIARALATNPELLVLDEPTSSLDVSVQAHILRLLAELQTRLGLTYVFITHDLAVVRVLASHVAVMYRGRVVEHGTVEAVFRAPRHRYTALLLASIPTVSSDDDHLKPEWPWNTAPKSLDVATQGCAFRPRCPFAIAACAQQRPEMTGALHRHACLAPTPGGVA
jgi:peptide/nickel transport system ATP-binding protein/oligopeptide transport system ATP-binding protein